MDPAVPILMLALTALVSGVLCAVVASEKNRNSGAWGMVGFLFPILTLIAIAGMPEKTRRIRECLFCAELIGIKATICPFCNRELKPVVHCTYSYCETTHIEPEQAVYRLCGKEGCDEQHAFCSESHANKEAKENYIRLNPQNAKAYNNRGLTYQSLGKVEEAERDFQKAKELGYVP